MRLKPALRLRGRLTLPGDKSISHRAAIIAALSRGTSLIQNFSTSRDCASTLQCLRELGVEWEQLSDAIRIKGLGLNGLKRPAVALDCGNSGSTMRMLAGVVAAHDFNTVLTGDESLLTRPMRRIIEPLEMMGARISSAENKPPLSIMGTTKLRSIDYEATVASAQVKSSILFAGLQAQGTTTVTERRITRDHTERLLKFFGVQIEKNSTPEGGLRITLPGSSQPVSRELRIPGDISSAAFFIGAAGLLNDSQLEIDEVGLNATRTKFLSVFRLLGLNVSFEERGISGGEPFGKVHVTGQMDMNQPEFQTSNRLPADMVPWTIDELPLLAVVGSQVTGGITVRGAGELRYKESDRIAATVANLRAMGADVDEFDDGFAVRGPRRLSGTALKSYGDHRIAMAFTVAALLADGDSELDDPECVSISFPEFFDLLESVVER